MRRSKSDTRSRAVIYYYAVKFGSVFLKIEVRRQKMARKRYSRSEKIFYGLSLLIVLSMVLGTVASLFAQ